MSNLFDIPPGGDEGFVRWLLHSDDGNLTDGFRVQMGNGVSTPLFLSSTGIGIYNGAGFRVELSTNTTANRRIVFPDASGALQMVLTSVLAGDYSVTSTTPATVPGFEIPIEVPGVTAGIESGGLYEFEMVLLTAAVVAGVALQFQIDGPSGMVFTTYDVACPSLTTFTTGNQIYNQTFLAWGQNFALTSPLGVGELYRITVRGTCKCGAAALSAGISVKIRSEVAANQVKLSAGSHMRFIKIN